jgi:MFS transporter, DHA1 family, multidrug resistance protein
MDTSSKPRSEAEFVALLALMVSIVALATDIMLPALATIGHDLGVADPNNTQLVVSALFLGFAAGQILAGPISDSIGRKPLVYVGLTVFIAGCLLSIFATNFSEMLAGRVLQGLGASAPRIITLAIVRDCYEGRAMARIMSMIMGVFIIVPAIAPSIGQGVIIMAGWRTTFGLLLVLSSAALFWFAFRQPETLPARLRTPFRFSTIADGILEACSHRTVVGYTITAGLIFGGFLGYLNSAQQIYQTTFNTGMLFPLYFGMAALAIGAAAFVNSMLVERLGMRLLTRRALLGISALSLAFVAPTIAFGGVPPIWLFMGWLLSTFFCVGILFGNLNALAMAPLGHIAGLGAAFVGSLTTFISLPLGWAIGRLFDGGVLPLVAGFAVLGAAGLMIATWTQRNTD